MRELNKYQNIIPVVSSTGGFYNPDEETNKIGEFYLHIEGIPKSIEISYRGGINVDLNHNLPKEISIFHSKQRGRIILTSISPIEYSEEKIFTFSGDIKIVNYVKIYNWADKAISSNIINYDQTNIPLNESETNLEDDSILIRYIEKKARKTYRFKKRLRSKKIRETYNPDKIKAKERLPENYVNRSKEKPQYCKNCYFLEGINHCHKWDATVSQSGWCSSWKKKEGVK